MSANKKKDYTSSSVRLYLWTAALWAKRLCHHANNENVNMPMFSKSNIYMVLDGFWGITNAITTNPEENMCLPNCIAIHPIFVETTMPTCWWSWSKGQRITSVSTVQLLGRMKVQSFMAIYPIIVGMLGPFCFPVQYTTINRTVFGHSKVKKAGQTNSLKRKRKRILDLTSVIVTHCQWFNL